MAIVKGNVAKGFGLFLHVKLNVLEQIVEKIKKANKVSDVEKKTQLTNTTFFTDNIPKFFMRPHLDYGYPFTINPIMLTLPKKSNPIDTTQH